MALNRCEARREEWSGCSPKRGRRTGSSSRVLGTWLAECRPSRSAADSRRIRDRRRAVRRGSEAASPAPTRSMMASATSETTSSSRTRPSPFDELPRPDPRFSVSLASRRESCQAGTKAARSPVDAAIAAVKPRTRPSSAACKAISFARPYVRALHVDAGFELCDPCKLWSRRRDLNSRPADYELSREPSEGTQEDLPSSAINDLGDP